MAAGETPSEAAGASVREALARAASIREAASEEAMEAMGATTIGAEALGAGRHEAAGEVRQLSSLCHKQQMLHTRALHLLHAGIANARSGLRHPTSCCSVMLMLATTRPLCWLPALVPGDAVTSGRRVLQAGQLHGRLQGDAQRRAALLPCGSQTIWAALGWFCTCGAGPGSRS